MSSCLVFSDEATFKTNGKVNEHNVCIWGEENHNATVEQVKDSQKVSVFEPISKKQVYGPFFFDWNVTGDVYLHMRQNWPMDDLKANEHEEHEAGRAPSRGLRSCACSRTGWVPHHHHHHHHEHEDFIFQQDGAPPNWRLTVQTYFNENLRGRRIERAGDGENVLLKWPLRSPDMTPCKLFLWSYVKGLLCVPLFLQSHRNLSRESLPHCRLLPKTCCSVFGRSWSTKLMCVVFQAERILNICEIGYEIHISLKFLFKYGGIILILFNIKPVLFN